MKFDSRNLHLYAVTNNQWEFTELLIHQVEEALKGGVTCLQYRDKKSSRSEMLTTAVQLKNVCDRFGIPLIINDHIDIAKASGADGVHLGQGDGDPVAARAILGQDKIIGVTVRTLEQAVAAQNAGADYLGAGAAFGSTTKTDAIPMSRETLRDICRSVSIPVVAIGGITRDNILSLSGTGIAGVAVVQAVFSEQNIVQACRELCIRSSMMITSKEESDRRGS